MITATCAWKPTTQNPTALTATITPSSNVYTVATSAPLTVLISKRALFR
jgi:hypothetical protein